MQEFCELKKIVREDAERDAEGVRAYVSYGYWPTWSEEYRSDPDQGLKLYSTARRWAQYTAGEISREKAVELATKRAVRMIEKREARQLAKIDRVAAAPDLSYISVSVAWIPSSTRGGLPHVEAWANDGIYTGTASGCGYDKESAAMANALNQCDSALKTLYTLKEKGLRAGISDRSETAATGRDNRKICGYGAGYGALPRFEGGVGASCFWAILEKCGFSTSSNHGKYCDFYRVTRNEA